VAPMLRLRRTTSGVGHAGPAVPALPWHAVDAAPQQIQPAPTASSGSVFTSSATATQPGGTSGSAEPPTGEAAAQQSPLDTAAPMAKATAVPQHLPQLQAGRAAANAARPTSALAEAAPSSGESSDPATLPVFAERAPPPAAPLPQAPAVGPHSAQQLPPLANSLLRSPFQREAAPASAPAPPAAAPGLGGRPSLSSLWSGGLRYVLLRNA
jgi:hypothetical protein